MIKFFRKIRKTLLSENKLSNYLMYAIGEIFLVVIGILIAIVLSNWNTNNQNKKRLQNQLLELKTENKANLVELESKIMHNNKIQSAILALLEYMGPDYQQKDERFIDSLFYESLSVSSLDVSAVAIQNIVTSEYTNLILNDALRNILIGWHARLEDIEDSENTNLLTFKSVFLPHFYNGFSMAKMDRRFDKELEKLGPSAFDIDNREKLNDLRTENILEDQYYNIGNQQRRYLLFKETLLKLDTLIDKELKND